MLRPLLLLLALTTLVAPAPLLAEEDGRPASRGRRAPRSAEGVTVTRDIEFAVVGDKRLLLDLYMPKSETPPPLLVWIHGGGWRAGSKDRVRLSWLVERGYALASISYRLSHEATFPAQIHDCKGAIRWLRANQKRLGYDARRIGVAGSSAGGHLVALLGTGADVPALEGDVGGNREQSSRVQAVVDLFGPADFFKMDASRGGQGAVSKLLGGAPATVKEVAALASPVTHVTKDDAPFLILHGAEDRLVPAEQSRLLDAKLDAAGVTSDLHVLEGARHGGPAFEADAAKADILAFLDKYLRGSAAVMKPTTQPAAPVNPTPGDLIVRTMSRAGAHATGSLPDLRLRDDERDFDLPVRVTYPTDAGTFPVIIWSHGAFGTKDRYQPLVEHWASRGYVVLQANHADSTARTGGRPDPSTFRKWAERPRDVKLMLDALPGLAAKLNGFTGTLDETRVGVGGHSFGAHTAQLMGGVRTTTGASGALVGHGDARVDAVLILSGQGRGEALDKDSWKSLSVPALVITGTKDDSGRTGKPYTWRKEPYDFAPKGDKTFVLIRGAHHGFGGITGPGRRGPGAGALNEAHVLQTQATTLLFWDAYLKADLGAKLLLRSKRIPEETAGNVAIEFK